MDADLYEQLRSTIPTDQTNSDVLDDEESGEDASESDDTRRQRTMSASLPQEIDQVVQAISSSQWAARLGNFMGNVRKQGESVLESTKHLAVKEFDHVRSELAAFTSPPTSPREEMAEPLDSTDPNAYEKQDAELTPPARLTASTMFSYLKSKADAAQKRITPTLKELSKAEDAADAYLNKLGASFGQLLKDVVTIAPPEESLGLSEKDGDVLFDTPTEKRRQIYTNRLDAMLHDLNTNPDLLCKNPDEFCEPSFVSWQATFSAEQRTDDIAALLDRYPELRSLMDSLVPEKISYKEFWMRYLYQKSKLDADEAKRKQLLESNLDENDFDWDGEDEIDGLSPNDTPSMTSRLSPEGKISTNIVKRSAPKHGQQADGNPRTSSTSESSTSFDIVSQSSAVPPIAKDKVPQATEESDDDWE